MSAQFTRLDEYVSRQVKQVQGYLHDLDLLAITELGKHQALSKFKGGLAEIGVHHGQLFLALAHLRQSGERSVAIDLFEDDEMNRTGEHAGRDLALFRNLDKFGIELEECEVLKGDSMELTPRDVLDRVGPVRLFSVDGGHLYHHVQNDLRIAADVMTEHGVIVVDDVFNIFWPDVTVATLDFLREQDGAYVPFLQTSNKLYLCRHDAGAHYRRFCRANTEFMAHKHRVVTMLGHKTLALWPKPGMKARVRKLIGA